MDDAGGRARGCSPCRRVQPSGRGQRQAPTVAEDAVPVRTQGSQRQGLRACKGVAEPFSFSFCCCLLYNNKLFCLILIVVSIRTMTVDMNVVLLNI